MNDILKKLIKHIKRYPKDNLLRALSQSSWKTFNHNQNIQGNTEKIMDITYSPYLICLVLSISKDSVEKKYQRKKSIVNVTEKFRSLWLKLEDKSIKYYFHKEHKAIYKALQLYQSEHTDKLKNLSINPISLETISILNWTSRKVTQQNKHIHIQRHDLIRTYHILKKYDETHKTIDAYCNKKYNMDFLKLTRILYFILLSVDDHGFIDFSTTIDDPKVVEKYSITHDDMRHVVEKNAIQIDDIKPWYENNIVLSNHYTSYSALPLQTISPIINYKKNSQKYFIPCPYLYMAHCFLPVTKYFSEQDTRFNTKLGKNIFEEYVKEFLTHTFKHYTVNQIEPESNADFYIDHRDCILIIEVKMGLSTNNQTRIEMKSSDIPELWKNPYKAMTQCITTAKTRDNPDNKPIIAIVLIGDYTLEAETFRSYAYEEKLLLKTKLSSIEYISVSYFEYILSHYSIDALVDILLARKESQIQTAFITEDVYKGTPAHQYEYLNESIKEVFL